MAPSTHPGQTSASNGELLELAGNVMSGGALGFLMLPRSEDVVIRKGRGSHLIGVDGREYIDYLMGSGPMLVGHCHPRIREAVEHQIRQGTTFYFLNEPAIRLAEEVIEAVPCAEQVRYVTTGSDATFLSLRAARAFTGRPKILKFEGGWHGTGDFAMFGTVPGEASDYPHAEPDSLGVPGVLADEVLVAPYNDTEFALQVIEEHADELAGVIIEPLQRVLRPLPGFLESVREACDRHGIVMIYDEIVTGFRLAWGGAQEAYGVVPDLACYGKAMAGGFPLAVITGRRDIMDLYGNVGRAPNTIAWASGTFKRQPGRGAHRGPLGSPGHPARTGRVRPATPHRRTTAGRYRRGGPPTRDCHTGVWAKTWCLAFASWRTPSPRSGSTCWTTTGTWARGSPSSA